MLEWWRSGVIYQVYPRSFADANGDGVGDLSGIIDRVDHLEWLGVDAVWVSPFFRSPMIDGGYDISDYVDIDPVFGTLQDFDKLVKVLHERKIRLIIDFVPNHSSNQHKWFQELRYGSSSKKDWYIWVAGIGPTEPPNNWESYFGGSAWDFDHLRQEWYLHTFDRAQPDLNWWHPDVREAMGDVLRFWLDRGADGIRVDVLWVLGKDEELRDNPPNPAWAPGQPPWLRQLRRYSEDRPESHDYAQFMRSIIDKHPGAVMVAEVVLPTERAVTYYGALLDEAHLPLNFVLTEINIWSSLKIAEAIDDYLAQIPLGGTPNWFLGNHDFERVVSRIGSARARLAHFMILTLPGVPILYYGDEIGLPNGCIPAHLISDPQARAFPDRSREAARTPMQWTGKAGRGFTAGSPWLPFADSSDAATVEHQREDLGSHLWLIRTLIRLRRQCAALAFGEYRRVQEEGALYCFLRSHPDGNVLIVLNFDEQEHAAPAAVVSGGALELSSELDSPAPADAVRPFEGRIYRLSKM